MFLGRVVLVEVEKDKNKINYPKISERFPSKSYMGNISSKVHDVSLRFLDKE